ncbi:Cation/multidrug efflux pump-like protein [Lentisphaera araneosa HTCC2155]|uniref:Cation/multidrug efflux pump-like protein n=1 Tax=Lentisphaera araneosa HTCC2155 TaxID=313628 RepID=A6DRA3_9BACT|nr:efflux RND transporter permease subunit [Lentisphaera araneosa]EDM25850.1 Cation/multidrug efflux pump-like protein [Lentisphaera araneosa HTCC2155]
MKNFIAFFLRQGVLLNIIFVGMIIFSATIALPNMPVEQFPNFTFGEVQISTMYPGATPDEVERLVTEEIEDSLRGMEDLDYIKSTSQADRSNINVKFVDDTDYKALYNELRFRVMGIQNRLPVQNGEPLTPFFSEADVDEWLPVIQVNLISKNDANPLPKRTLVLLAKDLRLRLEQIDKVKKVLLLGDNQEQYTIALDPQKLDANRITLQDVAAKMRLAGQAPPSGSITSSAGESLIRIDQRYRSSSDIYSITIRQDGDGNQVTVGDLVIDEESGIRKLQGNLINSINAADSTACKVLKLRSGNAFKIKSDVKEAVELFKKDYDQYSFEIVYTLDTTKKIKDGLGVLSESLVLSIIFVMYLLFIFLAKRSKKLTTIGTVIALSATVVSYASSSTLVQAIAIGVLACFVMYACRAAVLTISGIIFSFLGSLLIFYLTGQSINELTLLGFVLVSGIVVDDAIVVIENIQRHREMGKKIKIAVIDGTSEVFWPVLSATLTTMAAFLPLLLMTGSVGDFFSLVPIAVCTALAISIIECLILLPLHVIDLENLLGRDSAPETHKEECLDDFLNREGLLGKISRFYHTCLNWCLNHPVISILSSGLLFLIAIFIIIMPAFGFTPLLKLVFFPDNTSIMQIYVRMPGGTPMEETDKVVRKISEKLMAKGPKSISSTTAQSGMLVDLDYKPVMSNQYGFIMAELPPKAEREFTDAAGFIRDTRTELENEFEVNGIDLEVVSAKDGPPVGLPINVRVSGNNDETIMRAVDDIMSYLDEESNNSLKGIIDLKHDRQLRSNILSFKIDREKLAGLKLSEVDVQRFIADSLDGAYIADFRRSDEDIPLKLRLAESHIQDPVDLLNIPFINQADGKRVLFSDLGHFTSSTVSSSLIRWDFQRIVTISGNLDEDTKIGAINVSSRLNKWWLENRANYPGTVISFGGESESTGKSYRSLASAFLLAIILIYGILASQFRSYLQPLLIMSNIVFSFTGVIIVMALLGIGSDLLPEGSIRPERSFLTVNGFMAMVGLTGLVINDAIVLINFINQRIKDGLPLQQALLTAGHQRMRPIMMTTFTTIAGLLPMAIGIPDFSIAWSPFATAFIAGLTVSTSMTLLIIPVLFEILEKFRRNKFFKRFHNTLEER